MARRSSLAAILTVALLGAAVAGADDPAEDGRIGEANTFLEHLATLQEAKRKDELAVALVKAVQIHNGLKTDAVRAHLQQGVGNLLGDEALGAVRMKAADALGKFNDPDGAYAQLRPHLPPTKDPTVGPFPLRVVQAVGALAPDAALATLTKLMEKGKDANASRYAIQALGKYGWSKQRAKVLGSLAAFLKKLRPGGLDPRKGKAGGEAARERYDFLRVTLVTALNELTGRKLETPEQWLDLVKENKRTLEKLFIAAR